MAGLIVVLLVLGVGALFVKDDGGTGPIARGTETPTPTATATEPSIVPSETATETSSPTPQETEPTVEPTETAAGGDDDDTGDDDTGDDDQSDDTGDDDDDVSDLPETGVVDPGLAGLILLAGSGALGLSVRRRR